MKPREGNRFLLCDQGDETINHQLVSCVFSQQFWFHLLHQVGLQVLCPQHADTNFLDWWQKASTVTTGLLHQGLNSLIGFWIMG
jgi:hypothetical protein